MADFPALKRATVATVIVFALSAVTPGQARPRRLPRERDIRAFPRMKPRPGEVGGRELKKAERAGNKRLRLQQDIIRRINLSEDQRVRLREVMRSQEEDLIAAGRRARLARNELDRAMMSANFDEHEINRRADEFAAAQADLIRLQARRRAAVRKVLTPEQIVQFNEMEKELRRRQREQQLREGSPSREP